MRLRLNVCVYGSYGINQLVAVTPRREQSTRDQKFALIKLRLSRVRNINS